jgi:hypothetical protein
VVQAIIPEERTENLVGSLEAYLSANFTASAIKWQGVPFKEDAHGAWIEPIAIIGDGWFHRQVGPGQIGKTRPVIYNINIRVKQTYIEGPSVSKHIRARICDQLSNIFRETVTIPVKDHVTGGGTPPTVGEVYCFNTEQTEFGFLDNVAQYAYNCSVTMQWLQKWTTP